MSAFPAQEPNYCCKGICICKKGKINMNTHPPHNQEDYETNHSHTHCPPKDSPCGMTGEHRCCLCEKPVESVEEINKKWFEFCKFGGMHATEEAQVMWQEIESYFQTQNQQAVTRAVEGIEKYAREKKRQVEDDEYCVNESNDWKNGYDCGMYDVLQALTKKT